MDEHTPLSIRPLGEPRLASEPLTA
jgi:hypothetical protein